MLSLLLLALTSVLLALTVTPWIRDAAHSLGLVDRPDGARRLHRGPIPTLGGVAVAISYVGALLALVAISNLVIWLGIRDRPSSGAESIWAGFPIALRALPAAAAIFLTGILDDLFELKPWQKFGGQFAAAALAYWGGVQITQLGGGELHPGLGFAVTAIWLVGCSNAFNLIDGMDGLAAGTGAFAAATILLAALMAGNFPLALVSVPLLGALVGFLRYNFNPASIFLGDSGSLLIGFLLGCYGVLWSQKATTILAMTAPLMAMAVPLADTALAIARRFLRQQPIFGGDREHIHHKLLERGLTPRRAVLILYGACTIAAVFTLLGLASRRNDLQGLAIVLFVGSAWVGINRLGYREFGVAGRMLLQGAFQRQVRGRVAVEKLDVSLDAAETPEQVWQAIAATCEELGFRHAALQLGEHCFRREFHAVEHGRSPWVTTIPLRNGVLELSRNFSATANGPNPSLSRLSDVVSKRLGPAVEADMTPWPASETAREPQLAAVPRRGAAKAAASSGD